ncbi:MAG TPA: hypothetical protein GX400_22075 [Chloroflexi bacterium]|nr:hypothetical protein [Chloroflexota bacterium]
MTSHRQITGQQGSFATVTTIELARNAQPLRKVAPGRSKIRIVAIERTAHHDHHHLGGWCAGSRALPAAVLR